MIMDITGLTGVIMKEMKSAVRCDAIIGAPIRRGDTTVIPVSRISFGFGVSGGGRDVKKAYTGMGAGAGAIIEPVAFIALTGGKVRLLPVKTRKAKLSRFVEILPLVLKTMRGLMNRKKKKDAAVRFKEKSAQSKK